MSAALLEVALSNLLVAAALAGCAFAAGRWGKRPALTHALWVLVLLKLVTPPVVPLSLAWLPATPAEATPAAGPTPPPQTLTPEPQPEAPPVEPPTESAPPVELAMTPPAATVLLPVAPPTPSNSKLTDLEPGKPKVIEPKPPAPVEPATQPALAPAEARTAPPPVLVEPPPQVTEAVAEPPAPTPTVREPLIAWQDALVAAWLTGSGLWLALVAYRVRRFSAALRRASAPPAGFADEVAAAAREIGLRRVPRVRLIPGALAPMVWSFGRPTVFFPADLLARLSPDQRATLVAHELAHLKRADHLVRWLELVALALYWWCPLAWWAKRELQRAEEECCDAWVLEARPADGRCYAAALLDTLDFLAEARPAPALATGMGDVWSVKRRLLLILAGSRPKRLPLATKLALAVVALGLLPLAPRLVRLAAATPQDKPVAAKPAEPTAPAQADDDPYGEPVRFNAQPTRFQSQVGMWWGVAVSPDGKWVVTTHAFRDNSGGEFWVWDRAAGKVVRTVREPNVVRAALFAPDGKTLFTANFDKALRFYDTSTWEMWGTGYETTGGHTAGVNALAVTPDGKRLFTAGLDNTARLWDVEELTKRRVKGTAIRFGCVAVFEGHTSGVFSIAVSADGQRLLTGSGDNSARLWDVPAELPKSTDKKLTVKERGTLPGHAAAVEAVAISPDGQTLATGSWDQRVRLWDAGGKLREELAPYDQNVLALAFSKDGQHLAVGTGQPGDNETPGTVHVLSGGPAWKAITSKPLSLQAHAGPVYSVAFLPDDRTIASASRDRTVRVRKIGDAGDGVVMKPADAAANVEQMLLAAALSPDGKRLVVGGENKVAVVWDVADKKPVFVLTGHADVIAGAAFSPDGKVIATASNDKTIKLWDAATGKELRTLKGHVNWVFGVAFSPNGELIASGGYDRTVRVWDAATGEPKATWKEHTAGVRAVAFAGNDTLLSASADRTVRVWDVKKGTTLHTLRGHKSAVRSVAVSPDGATAATAGEDKTVRVWDIATGKETVPAVETPDLATVVRFSPKGHALFAGTYDGGVFNINPTTGRLRAVLSGGVNSQQLYVPGRPAYPTHHSDAVTGLLFAPDGTAYSVGQDKAILAWKPAAAPATARTVFRAGDAVAAAAASPDGKLFVTGDRSGAVRVWDANTGEQLRELHRHPGGVTALAFSADGKKLLVGGADKLARLWDAEKWDNARLFENAAPVFRAAVSPDGKTVALALDAGPSDVWLIVGTAAPKALAGHADRVKALAFSPDGKTLLSGGADGQVIAWDATTAKEKAKVPAKPMRCWVDALAFAPDGKSVAVAVNYPGSPQVNDVQGEQELHEVDFFDVTAMAMKAEPVVNVGRPVTALAYGPAGRQLVVATDDGKVRYWDAGSKRVTRTIDAHLDATLAIAVGADGVTLYTAGEDRLAKRWDTPAMANYFMQARLFANTGQTWATFFSPDNKYVATAGDDNMVRLRTTVPGEGRGGNWFKGAYPGCLSVALSPDEKLLATGHFEGQVRLTDMTTGAEVRKFTGLPSRAWTVRFSPDGQSVAACGGDWTEGKPGWAKVWAVADGKERFTLGDHPETCFAVAYSPDGRHVTTGCRDGKVRVFSAATGELVRTQIHGTTTVRAVTYTPDGKQLVSGGWDGRVVFWDADTGEEKSALVVHEKGRVNRVVFSPTKPQYAVAYNEVGDDDQQTGRVAVYKAGETAPVQTVKDFTGMVLDVALHPDGITLAAVGGRYNQFPECRFFDIATGAKLMGSPGHKHWVEAVAFNKAGTLVVSGGGVEGEPGEVRVRTALGLRPRAVLKGHVKAIRTGAFSPDGSLIATGAGDGTIFLTDVAKAVQAGGVTDAAVKFRLPGKLDVRQLLFSRDGKKLFGCYEDGHLTAWDVATGTEAKSVKAHGLPVYGLALSPDGKTLATSAGDWKAKSHGEVKLWSADTLEPAGEFARQDEPVWAVAFAKDGKSLYTAGKGIRVLDIATKAEKRRVAAGKSFRCLVASPDGKFATAAEGGRVTVFDTATWQEVGTMSQHQKLVLGLSYSPDGKVIASSSGDGSAILWRNAGNTPTAATASTAGNALPPGAAVPKQE